MALECAGTGLVASLIRNSADRAENYGDCTVSNLGHWRIQTRTRAIKYGQYPIAGNGMKRFGFEQQLELPMPMPVAEMKEAAN
jgi:hypothetical protein